MLYYLKIKQTKTENNKMTIQEDTKGYVAILTVPLLVFVMLMAIVDHATAKQVTPCLTDLECVTVNPSISE